MNPQHEAAMAEWEQRNREQAEMGRDHIDIIGEGGAAIEADDIDTLKRIAQRLRDHVKAFPWAVTKQPEIAACLHTDANALTAVIHRLEHNR